MDAMWGGGDINERKECQIRQISVHTEVNYFKMYNCLKFCTNTNPPINLKTIIAITDWLNEHIIFNAASVK